MIVDPGYSLEKSPKKHRMRIRCLQAVNPSANGNHPVHRVHPCAFILFENVCIGAYITQSSTQLLTSNMSHEQRLASPPPLGMFPSAAHFVFVKMLEQTWQQE